MLLGIVARDPTENQSVTHHIHSTTRRVRATCSHRTNGGTLDPYVIHPDTGLQVITKKQDVGQHFCVTGIGKPRGCPVRPGAETGHIITRLKQIKGYVAHVVWRIHIVIPCQCAPRSFNHGFHTCCIHMGQPMHFVS